MRYIKKYTNETDVQTDLNNEVLGKPYVAYITSGSSLDWNSKDLAIYIGEWSGYTFTVIDSGATAWENPVEIATIPTAYIQGDECSVSVTLRYEYDVWWLKFEAEGQSASDDFELDPYLSSVSTEYVKLDSDGEVGILVQLDAPNYSFSSEDSTQPLVMNTINIEEE